MTLGAVRGRPNLVELTRRLAALAGRLAGLSRAWIRAARLSLRCARLMARMRAAGRTVTVGAVRSRSGFLELTRRLAALAGCLAGLSRARIRAARLSLRCARQMAFMRAVGRTVTLGTVRGRSSFLELTRRLAALAGCLAGLSRSRIRAVRLNLRCA